MNSDKIPWEVRISRCIQFLFLDFLANDASSAFCDGRSSGGLAAAVVVALAVVVSIRMIPR